MTFFGPNVTMIFFQTDDQMPRNGQKKKPYWSILRLFLLGPNLTTDENKKKKEKKKRCFRLVSVLAKAFSQTSKCHDDFF